MRWFLLLMLSWLPVAAALPLRPIDGIYDPVGWLEESAETEMARNIVAAREKGKARVFVAIVPKGQSEDMEGFALSLGRAWGEGELWGLLFHVIDDPEGPRFYSELGREVEWTEKQKLSFQTSIKQALEGMEKKVKLSNQPQLRVQSGTRVMSDDLGYLGLVMARIDHNNAQARGDREPEEGKPEAESAIGARTIFTIVLGVLIVLSIFFLMTLKKDEEKELEYHFPETSPRRRFLAPWSGGGNTLVDFRNHEVDRKSGRSS